MPILATSSTHGVVDALRYFALEDALAAILHPCSNAVADALPLPLAMHRLDVRVCGLLLVAKTRTGAVSIARQLADRTVEKTYRALLIGRLPSDLSRVETAVNGQEAQTSVRVLSHVPHAHWGDVTHVELQPHTGRTHQLRIHMAALGAPIIGDDLYHDSIGREARARLGGDPLPPVAVKRGLFLQSVRVAFRHPKHGEMMELAVDEITKHTSLLDKMKRSAEYRKLE
uniref:Pseudouridine synthase RsuA/RluA-like domain-containing protein n=1 Tax=Chrysotila carterae TaxID=13221 RepID=A0A7S4C232_CHRCT